LTFAQEAANALRTSNILIAADEDFYSDNTRKIRLENQPHAQYILSLADWLRRQYEFQ
jgi:hypothetical protein